MADFAVGQSRMLYGTTMHSERAQHRMSEQWHPLGPVGVITAFNFPVAVWAWNAFLAAIAGDTVVWKPSPKAPLCAIAVQHLCNRVMEQQGYRGIFSLIVTAEKSIAEMLVQDRRFPLISFTGSVPVGRAVASTVAQRLGRTLLELSGNNAIIVDEMADLSLAIRAIVFGAVGTAGQRCTTTRRLFVHESRYDEVVTKLISAYRQIRIGNPLESGVLMGPLIDRAAVEAYRKDSRRGEASGGESPLRRAGTGSAGLFRRAGYREGGESLAHRPARDLCADSLRHALQGARRRDRVTECSTSRPVICNFYVRRAEQRAVHVYCRQRLRDCQCEYRDVGSGNRRRLWRRKGNRRRARGWLGCLESLYAAADEHDQLGQRFAVGSGHSVRLIISVPDQQGA